MNSPFVKETFDEFTSELWFVLASAGRDDLIELCKKAASGELAWESARYERTWSDEINDCIIVFLKAYGVKPEPGAYKTEPSTVVHEPITRTEKYQRPAFDLRVVRKQPMWVITTPEHTTIGGHHVPEKSVITWGWTAVTKDFPSGYYLYPHLKFPTGWLRTQEGEIILTTPDTFIKDGESLIE